jgi:hypothetical protein
VSLLTACNWSLHPCHRRGGEAGIESARWPVGAASGPLARHQPATEASAAGRTYLKGWDAILRIFRLASERALEAGADLILGGEVAAEAYAVHFEAQMYRGKVRKALYVSYLHFARAGASLARLAYLGFGDLPPR